MTFRSGPERKERVATPADFPGHKPPCRTAVGCPKVSPEQAHLHELSDRNWQFVEWVRQVRATQGRCLTPEALEEPRIMADLTAVESLLRAHESEQHARRMALSVLEFQRE